ncbi:MAG: hypothetical protein RLZZ156_1906 [Deinococcota bacterium]|jgi:hypothetical protein
MRILVNLVLFFIVAAAFAWWLRPYWGRWKRLYQGAKNTFKFVRQVRDATKNGGFTVRGGTDFLRTGQTDFSQARKNPKTVDVTPKMTVKVGCPVCKEMLSEAQLEAMRSGGVRCPAMIQNGANCPYYGRTLN